MLHDSHLGIPDGLGLLLAAVSITQGGRHPPDQGGSIQERDSVYAVRPDGLAIP